MPAEALARERICRIVSDGFASHGYLPVETPLLEDRASLSRGARVDDAAFQLFDGGGRLLMMRSDLTMPIARMASTRLDPASGPFRLRYMAPVVREQAEYLGRSRQFTQLGIELIGDAGASADVEVVSLAAEALEAVGMRGWRIVCGSVKPMKELLDACVSKEEDRRAVLSLIHTSDLVGLDSYVDGLSVPQRARDAIRMLPRIWGDASALDEAAALLEPYVVGDGGVGELRALFTAAQDAGFADRLSVDFSVMNSFDYYTGLVFAAYVDGSAAPLASGGRYDEAFRRFGGASMPAAGFALTLEAVEGAIEAAEALGDGSQDARPLRIAVPKGSLFSDSVAVLAAAGLDVEPLRDPGRHLVVHGEGVDYVIVRPTDAPAFVASGGADCGICGLDSLVEAGFDLMQMLDLGFGACRFVVAEPRDAKGAAQEALERRGCVRVSTKYPRITQMYYDRIGQQVDIVTLHGNIELGPMVGMSERIVDITATGTTLRENDLVIVDEVMECTARFFASPARVRCDERIRRLAAALSAGGIDRH